MKTLKQIHAERLLSIANANLANAHAAALRLIEDYDDGKITACQVRKQYTALLEGMEINALRVYYLMNLIKNDNDNPGAIFCATTETIKNLRYFFEN